jgi:hypothetical protein
MPPPRFGRYLAKSAAVPAVDQELEGDDATHERRGSRNVNVKAIWSARDGSWSRPLGKGELTVADTIDFRPSARADGVPSELVYVQHAVAIFEGPRLLPWAKTVMLLSNRDTCLRVEASGASRRKLTEALHKNSVSISPVDTIRELAPVA